MKVLIADDLQPKISRLVDLLTNQIGLAREDVLVAQTAMEARRILRDTQIDLFILDVLLPLRAEDSPSSDTSIELLEELAEEGLYLRPSYVLGLTAYPEAVEKAGPHFRERLWTIIQFDQSSNEWAKPISNCIDYIRNGQRHLAQAYKTDLCIVTALASPEMEAVHRLPWDWDSVTPLDDTTFVRPGSLCLKGQRHSVVTSVPSRMGMVSTALLAYKLIAAFRPRFLAMTGVCAGVREKTRLGDIIFVDPTWDWQSGKRVKDKDNTQFAIAPHQLPASEFIRARVQQLASNSDLWHEIRKKWPSPPSHELRLLVGPVASGSAVLADGQVVTEIKVQERNLLGIEMECYGLFAAASLAAFPRPTVIAFKSVCDFADPDKKDEFQAYAAYTSANALHVFMNSFLSDILELAGT
jgi:nucleoside phosphorylase/CheY-like chemotaxis protein